MDILSLVKEFDKYIIDNKLSIEAMCLSNKDGIIFENHYNDTPNIPRNIYSHSKSYLSLLVGIAIDEGLLHLDDHIVDILKDEINPLYIENNKDITLRHCLTMSSGYSEGLLFESDRRKGIGYPDYLNYIMSKPIKSTPGTHYTYSNGDTYLCSRCVEKVYNNTLCNIAYEKLFKKMDIGYPLWETDPYGHCIAASGLRLKISDMNKIGILILNDGIWKNERLISHEYIDMLYNRQNICDTNLWGEYSFQFWLMSNQHAIRCDGAYGQYTFIYPEHNIALSIQRKEDDLQKEVIDKLIEMVLVKL